MTASGGELTPLKRSLLAIEQLQARIRTLESDVWEPVAVLGIGCRLPGGVTDPESFFELLRAGTDAISPAPPVPRPTWGTEVIDVPPAGYLDLDVGAFDPAFFGISPREARGMDPQQRISLECAWEALEDACVDPFSLENSATGVFMGVTGNDYAQVQSASERALELLDTHYTSGVAHSMISGRLSYLWGLRGPSLSIDTACSSSLVALHLAARSLQDRETDLALAGGVNLILTPDYARAFQRSRMLAPDGRCKTFSARADGFARGEGCAVVVLKRLSDALRSGDPIRAVLRGSAVNQDGPSSGLTAPNGPAQEAVIREALVRAGWSPGDVDYVEAHGTGTELGDPIEALALGGAYGRERPANRPLLVGSVKTNFGHVEAAAGVVGFVKAVLCVEKKEIPPHLHFDEPSAHIPWERLPLRVVHDGASPEPRDDRLRAGVSSFGFSGTNAHALVETFVPEREPPRIAATRPRLLVLSAPHRAGLASVADRWADHLDALDEEGLVDACHSAATGRARFPDRIATVAVDSREVASRLRSWSRNGSAPGVLVGTGDRDADAPAFLFTGQGAQFPGMGRTLLEHGPAFREAIQRCADLLEGRLEAPLLDVFDPASSASELVHRTDITQPAIFALQYALCEQLEAWGVTPGAVLGHSIGEYAAAHVAGVFSLEDALDLVVTRGRLMHEVDRPGRMLAVFCDGPLAENLIAGFEASVSIAAVNAPGHLVVSGATTAIGEVEARAAERGIRTRALRTSQAFHSPLMDPVVTGMRDALRTVSLSPPTGPRFVSSVSGGVVGPGVVDVPEYWATQVREPVQFALAAAALAERAPLALEVGPRPTLSALVAAADLPLVAIPALVGGDDATHELMEALGGLWTHGVEPLWAAITEGKRTRIPRTPFERAPHWVDLGSGGRRPDPEADGILGWRVRLPGGQRAYQSRLRAEAPAFIAEHVVGTRPILPGTSYLSAAWAAARGLYSRARLTGIDFLSPMPFTSAPRLVHTEITPGVESATFAIHSVEDVGTESDWVRHATGVIEPARGEGTSLDLSAIRARCPELHTHDDFYERARERGYAFGPRLLGVEEVRVGPGEALGVIRLPDACRDDPERFALHPLLLDAALQVTGSALQEADTARPWLPVAIDEFAVASALPDSFHAHATVTEGSGETVRVDVTLVDPEGAFLASLRGVAFRQVHVEDASESSFFELGWSEIPPETSPDLQESVESSLRRFADEEDAAEYDAFVGQLEERSLAWVGCALAELGWSPEPGSRIDGPDLRRSLGVVSTKTALFERCLDILAEGGLLRRGGSEWIVEQAIPDAAPGDGIPSTAESRLLDRCGAIIAGTLRGTVDPLETLFPPDETDGDTEAMYRDAPFARVFGRTLAETVVGLARERDVAMPLRILEVGAGTGGATGRIVDALVEHGLSERVRYTFTDVSPHFAERARARFAAFPSMDFDVFDLDRDPMEQGFEEDAYDVVVAASCIHASRDIERALRGLNSLLRPGGALLAVEVLGPHRWFDVTVGLTDSWWHHEDRDERGAYPCPAPDIWTAFLTKAGFSDIAVLPMAGATPGPHGIASTRQGIILANAGVGVDGASGRPWLVVAADQAFSRQIAEEVQRIGGSAEAVPADEAGRRLAEGACAGVAHVVTAVAPDEDPGPAIATHLDFARAAIGAGGTNVSSVRLVTRGAQIASDYDSEPDAAGAAMWGLSRTIGLEAPDLRPARLDLETTCDTSDAAAVARWLVDDRGEPDRARRFGSDRVPRLRPPSEDPTSDLPERYRLTFGERGSLSALRYESTETKEPGPEEVKIAVAATAMNFKDVLNVLDLYPGDPGPLGSECSGVVVAVGAESGFEVGARVLAIAGDAYAEEVVADARLVAPIPPGLSFAEAATIPIAYLTAHVALTHLGRLGPEDRVLIHAATGGVGTAARAIAKSVGAQVLATAGTEAKRERLRSEGVEHVFDSRSATFEEGILEATGGVGVDVVLNSLADELVGPTFAVAARGARFLEIGKRGIWTEAEVEALGREIEYHVIDWGETFRSDPDLITRLFREVVARVGERELTPLPSTRFPAEQVEAAFRFMAAGHHVGKVVALHPVLRPRKPLTIAAGAVYLVSGGLSGLGLFTARWLADRGAGGLVLVGRRAPGAEQVEQIEEIRASGTTVDVVLADVGDADAMDAGLAAIAPRLERLRGVIHAAGSLRNATIEKLTDADFEAVFTSKLHGTRVLLGLAREHRVDFFVAYSSIAGLFGSPGQANHSAANTSMDTAVAAAWPHGAGMSIAWGPWSETGSATAADVLARTESLGIGSLSNHQGRDLVERAFTSPAPYRVCVRIDAPEELSAHRSQRMTSGLTSRTRQPGARPAGSPAPADGELRSRLSSEPEGARRGVIASYVRDATARILGLPEHQEVGLGQPLGELGLDSLLAVELRNVLGSAIGVRLPSTLLFDYPSIGALTDFLIKELGGTTHSERGTMEPSDDPLDSLDDLSDEEVERLLSSKIDDV